MRDISCFLRHLSEGSSSPLKLSYIRIMVHNKGVICPVLFKEGYVHVLNKKIQGSVTELIYSICIQLLESILKPLIMMSFYLTCTRKQFLFLMYNQKICIICSIFKQHTLWLERCQLMMTWLHYLSCMIRLHICPSRSSQLVLCNLYTRETSFFVS